MTHPSPRELRQVNRPTAPPPPPKSKDGAEPDGSNPDGAARFSVRILDNPVNTYDEVISVCIRVLGVSLEEAFRIAYAVDHEGGCVVGAWPRAEAERIAAGIAVIGIEVRIEAGPS
jgi:ATP-dependent Clp protease adapter protein ClpS